MDIPLWRRQRWQAMHVTRCGQLRRWMTFEQAIEYATYLARQTGTRWQVKSSRRFYRDHHCAETWREWYALPGGTP